MERGLPSRLKQLYGREVVSLICLARAQLYVSLAVTATHVPTPVARYFLQFTSTCMYIYNFCHFLPTYSHSSAGKSTGAPWPPTNLSTVTGSPRSSAPSSPGSTRPPETTKRIKSDIKLMLLVYAERELMSAWSESSTGSDVKTRSVVRQNTYCV